MLPLGNFWAGICRAVPGEDWSADDETIRPLCQLGYARGQCRRFPDADGGADAVRFMLRKDDGQQLHLSYVLERDHHPLLYGRLEYCLAQAAFAQAPANPIVCRQAEAYVASYLRRKSAG